MIAIVSIADGRRARPRADKVLVRSLRVGLLVAVATCIASNARAQPSGQPAPVDEARPRFALGPSLAVGITTPSSGSLFTSLHGLVDVRFVVAIRTVGPLWVRLEPGTTMSWNNTNEFTLVKVGDAEGTSGVPDARHTVRVHSVGVRALAALDLASRLFVLRGGGSVSYGGAALPDACSGEARGGAGFGGVLGGGIRPDTERRVEIGAELGVFIYPYVDKCAVNRAERRFVARLQENPELAFTVGVTWFVF